MKPMLLYSMPRARGTVSLHKSLRAVKLNEPFRQEELNLTDTSAWDIMVKSMNHNDSSTKIHGYHLQQYEPGNIWYQQVMRDRSHEVVVIERTDRINMLLSDILATHHGYNFPMHDNHAFTVHERLITRAHNVICQHLIYYPTYGKVVTFETLPTEFFNKELVAARVDQKSYLRHNCITNIEWCKDVLGDILDFYKKDWDNKILSLNPTWIF